ncbi:hypothetical protein CKJ90_30990, partial [Klebsiella pneumoniae]
WEQPLAAMTTPYIFPTENGLRCDTQALDWGAGTSAVISTSPFSHGAPVSCWEQPLAAMTTPYIFPTENGLRCDTQALDWGAG